jgi:hypothetical protein
MILGSVLLAFAALIFAWLVWDTIKMFIRLSRGGTDISDPS